MELGPINKFLYGVLITVCIIMMIFYCIWCIGMICEDRDIEIKDKWSEIKKKVQEKWYGWTSKIKYSR